MKRINKPILIDVSLTGGRGPAKKVYEFITDLKDQSIPYIIVTDQGFSFKLSEMGISPDLIVKTSLNESPQEIIQKFYEVISEIDYSFLVKFGARAAGPTVSRRLGRPYYIVDGGLPDYLSNKEDLYDKKTFQSAKKYIVTSQFAWKFPKRVELKNIEVCAYPISKKSFTWLEKLEKQSKNKLLTLISKKINDPKTLITSRFCINLVMTGDYLRTTNRVTYGGWLTAKQYDQCIGFIRRLVIDLGENFRKETALFVDLEIFFAIQDLTKLYPDLKIITYKEKWSFETEVIMQKFADITISRASNYQPYIAALAKRGSVTTPVPTNGYMDEDTAGIQYENEGLTKLINYDDEQYIFKLIDFIKDKSLQKKIEVNLRKNKTFLKEKNVNQVIINEWKNKEI